MKLKYKSVIRLKRNLSLEWFPSVLMGMTLREENAKQIVRIIIIVISYWMYEIHVL